MRLRHQGTAVQRTVLRRLHAALAGASGCLSARLAAGMLCERRPQSPASTRPACELRQLRGSGRPPLSPAPLGWELTAFSQQGAGLTELGWAGRAALPTRSPCSAGRAALPRPRGAGRAGGNTSGLCPGLPERAQGDSPLLSRPKESTHTNSKSGVRKHSPPFSFC